MSQERRSFDRALGPDSGQHRAQVRAPAPACWRPLAAVAPGSLAQEALSLVRAMSRFSRRSLQAEARRRLHQWYSLRAAMPCAE
jgi:hypothetical protein